MKEFLERIKLIQYVTPEIEIQKNEFVYRFRLHTDESDTGLFSATKNEYKREMKLIVSKLKDVSDCLRKALALLWPSEDSDKKTVSSSSKPR